MLLKVTWAHRACQAQCALRLRLNAVCFWRPAIARFRPQGGQNLLTDGFTMSKKTWEVKQGFPPALLCRFEVAREKVPGLLDSSPEKFSSVASVALVITGNGQAVQTLFTQDNLVFTREYLNT